MKDYIENYDRNEKISAAVGIAAGTAAGMGVGMGIASYKVSNSITGSVRVRDTAPAFIASAATGVFATIFASRAMLRLLNKKDDIPSDDMTSFDDTPSTDDVPDEI